MSAGARGGPANRPASRGLPRQTAAQAQSTDALANQAGRGGVMGMPGQGMATAGAPVKERDQKGPTVANGAGKGWDVRRKERAPSRGQGLWGTDRQRDRV